MTEVESGGKRVFVCPRLETLPPVRTAGGRDDPGMLDARFYGGRGRAGTVGDRTRNGDVSYSVRHVRPSIVPSDSRGRPGNVEPQSRGRRRTGGTDPLTPCPISPRPLHVIPGRRDGAGDGETLRQERRRGLVRGGSERDSPGGRTQPP